MNDVRLVLSVRAALLTAGASFALPAMAQTPIGPPPVSAVAEQPAEPVVAAPETVEDAYDDYSEDEIVVTAPRLAGQLDTDIKAEAELDEAAIASYGVSNVSELLDALAPQTRSGRGRGGGRPIILVNGRRIGGFGEVRNLPPEAIAKVEVFPEEVALQYGYSADERVVNMVLKPNFRQVAVEAEGGIPTQGGRFQSEIQPSFLAIGKNGRVNINAGWDHKTMLLESERDLDYATDEAGQALAAGAPARSLLGASDEYSIDATVQRSLNKTTDASLNVRWDQTDSLSWLGPRNGDAADPLTRDSRSRNLTTTASVNGMLGDWRWSLSGNYADADQLTFTDRFSDNVSSTDRFDSSQQTFGGSANLSGTVTEGWAGPIRLSMTGSYSGLRFDSRSARAGDITTTDLGRDLPGVFGSLTIPLLDPEYEVGKIGRVSLTLSGQVQNPSDFDALKSWGANLNWGVTDNLSLIASYNSDEAAPGIQQLGAAPLDTQGVTYYDLQTGQTVQITTTTGGNPFLLAEQRRDLKLGLNWSPPMVEGLNLSINYNSNKSYDTANSFPLLTPEIEAAFPDRVERDINGVLTRIDQRPVNFDRAENSQIRWGLNFGKSFGQQQQRGPGGARPDGAGAREGGGGPGAGRPRGGGGGPRMGGRGPGGPGGMFGGPQGGRWQVSLYHTIKLTDKVLIRPGVPELDLLNGSATGSGGGSNRHLFELDGGLFNKGMGVRLSAKYDSGSTVTGGTAGDLKFGDLATFNLRFFVDLGQKPKLTEKLPFLKGSRVRLAIDNIFDAQRKITDANGIVPLNYQPGYIDPLGRYIELEWRKTF